MAMYVGARLGQSANPQRSPGESIYGTFSVMAKVISGHGVPKSAMAMVIVAIAVAPPLM